MGAEIERQQISERILRQVRKDSVRALLRARYCTDRSEIVHLRCVDDRGETDKSFGSQLWYFEGLGVDEHESQQLIYGVMEYSIQFGLQELIDDGVFDCERERERFRSLYRQESVELSWRQPPHRWLAIGVLCSAAMTLTVLLVKSLVN